MPGNVSPKSPVCFVTLVSGLYLAYPYPYPYPYPSVGNGPIPAAYLLLTNVPVKALTEEV